MVKTNTRKHRSKLRAIRPSVDGGLKKNYLDDKHKVERMEQETEPNGRVEEEEEEYDETAVLIAPTERQEPEITCVCSLEEEEKVLSGWPGLSLMSKVCCRPIAVLLLVLWSALQADASRPFSFPTLFTTNM